MAKLTVKNIGPIKEAELEVKKHTIFIGPQGSEKSALAKLIAIGGDGDILLSEHHWGQFISMKKYNMDGYLVKEKSAFSFSSDNNEYLAEYQESGIKEIERKSILNKGKISQH